MLGFGAALFSLLMTACLGTKATGDAVTTTFSEKDFHGLDVSIGGDAEVLTGPDFKVEITCEESVAKYLDVRVEKGILKIDFDHAVYDVDGLKIKVTAPNWDEFNFSGSADAHVAGPISGNKLKIDLSGSSDFTLDDAQFDKTEIDLSGSGGVTIAGQGDDLDCELSGKGDVRAFGFPVKTAKIDISGLGDVEVNVSDKLDASISGAGDVRYMGSPQVTSDVSGIGKVKKI